MNDRMSPIPFAKLMDWILNEKESLFGVKKRYKANPEKYLNLFDGKLEIPAGPAAGPHTQLAQNIIAAYIAGARFFELKTVQTLDGENLPVAKPCIFAPDECYNVEWSTELLVEEAAQEYIKAWFALKLISKEFQLGDCNGFIFNMSVGYDLEGIMSPKIDTFINQLTDASSTPIWQSCYRWALSHLELFKFIDRDYLQHICPHVSTSITLSTLHGCPPQTIESIATYLLTQKNLHTFIKCNPTLLGYDYTRQLLNTLGYTYLSFTPHHFIHDLQFEDACPMFTRLMACAKNLDLEFGVKLTNTFPVKITSNQLPGEEMYMSGRSLFPLTLSLAHKLAHAFSGELKMSFSGGADALNIAKLLQCGIYPITLATTLLKPGGYNRLYQIATTLAGCDYPKVQLINLEQLDSLYQHMPTDTHYQHSLKPLPHRKLQKSVPLIGCTTTPCHHFCPINQDIPEYIRLVGEGQFLEALKVITLKNPLPFTTGTICNHHCTTGCRRHFYDEPIDIRGVKKIAATEAFDALLAETSPTCIQTNKKVAIIGGGVAGLSCSYFLAKAGISVTLFEKTSSLGGIVRHIIPDFRMDATELNKDIRLIHAQGVTFKLNTTVTSIKHLQSEGFDFVIVATGATKALELSLEGESPLGVMDFLKTFKNAKQPLNLGAHVAIIGGGNTAMDAARAAKRVLGVKDVSIIYRRTKSYMPADEEELKLAEADGIHFKELLSPIAFANHQLTCEVMALGPCDASMRRQPVSTGKTTLLQVDTLISAIGETLDSSLYTAENIALETSGYPSYDLDTLEVAPNVFAIGDCLKGPATIVLAIQNAQVVADCIIDRVGLEVQNRMVSSTSFTSPLTRLNKKTTLQLFHSAPQESSRCLECDVSCGCCIDVCPNRANVGILVNGHTEILHLDALCNACGNCTLFCPYNSSPYLDKLTLFSTLGDFNSSQNFGVYIENFEEGLIHLRLNDHTFTGLLEHYLANPEIKSFLVTLLTDYAYLL